jgi:hypothetical protein
VRPVVSRPWKQAVSDIRTVLSRLRMMLVTFIALTCVSCSLFPKKELSGTADEKPKAAQNILTTLSTVNSTLDVLYTSVSRGLDSTVLESLEYFIVEAAAKKSDRKEQAALVKTGLEILVDLKSTKIDASTFSEAILALRRAIILFDIQTLRYLQDVGRLPVPQTLALRTELFTINNSLARGLFTLSAVVSRAGLEPQNGTLPELRSETKSQITELESRLVKLKTETFLALQPFLADALVVANKIDTSSDAALKQTDFAISAFTNGILLSTALQTQKDSGQIDKNYLSNSIKAWSTELKSISAAVATGAPGVTLPTIPETAPKLDLVNGALPQGVGDWVFSLVENPTQGSVDLSKNPPVYTPTSPGTFSIDRYAFRACLKMIPTFCTASFSVVVQTPIKPWTVSIKTSEGVANQFVRGDDLVCSAALENPTQTAVYRWTLVGLRNEGGIPQSKQFDVTSWQVSPGLLRVPNVRTAPNGAETDVRAGDRIRCEVKARLANGLESAYTAATLASMTALNSAPSNIYLAADALGFEEQVGGAGVPANSKLSVYIDDLDAPDVGSYVSGFRIQGCDGGAPCTCAGRTPCPFSWESPTDTSARQDGRFEAKLVQTQTLNFEDTPYFDLPLTAVDTGGQELTKVIRIPVIDKNDPITEISPQTSTVAENTVFSKNLEVIDQDCAPGAACQSVQGAQGYVYSLLNERDASYFEMNGRILKSKAALDFEQIEGGATKSTYTVKVRATDPRGGTFDETLTINVSNENEAPTGISFTGALVSENSSEMVDVGTLTTSDPDAATVGSLDADQNQYQYTLTMLGTTTPYFKVSGRKVIPNNAHPINFEQTSQLSFMITSRDPGGKTVTSTFTVQIRDENEAPTGVSFSAAQSVIEKSIQGRDEDNLSAISLNSILRIYGIDPDDANDQTPQEQFTFQITEINGSEYDAADPVLYPFKIIGQDLHPQRVLNYSSLMDRVTRIKIKATDQGGLTMPGETELVLKLIEINFKNGSEPTLVEGEPAKALGDLCVAEGATTDCSLAWTYSLVAPPAGNFFSIAASSTELRTTKELDFETFPGLTRTPVGAPAPQTGFFYLKINATKPNSGLNLNQKIKINLNNTNERPSAIQFVVGNANTGLTLLDGQAASNPSDPNDIIGHFTTTDEDIGDISYWRFDPSTVRSPDSQYFELVSPVNGDSKRANLRIKTTLPTGRSQFTIAVRAEDDGRQEPVSGGRSVTFNVLAYPRVDLNTATTPLGPLSRFNKGLDQLGVSGLQVDVLVRDASDANICQKVSGNVAGIHIESLSNAGDEVLSDAGISVATKSTSANSVVCTLSLMPNLNRAGDASFNVRVKSERAGGLILASQSVVSVPVTFWRKPELRCPKRISLPVGTPLDDIPCEVHFSDSSAPADRSAESVTTNGCGLSWSSGKLSGGTTMPADQCSTTVSVSGVTNKFGVVISLPSQTLTLAPRKFGTNGPVFASTKDSNGNLYLAGAFTGVDPIPAPGITAVQASDATRAAACNLTEGFNGPVNAIVYDSSDNSFLVGGEFTLYRNQPALRLVRLTCSGEPAAWFDNDGFDGAVRALARESDGSILVGGSFEKYGNVASAGLVRLRANGSLRTSYPGKISLNDSSEGVYALSLASTSGTAWVGGRFSGYGGGASSHNHLVRINVGDGTVPSVPGSNEFTSPGINAPVRVLRGTANGVFAGGEFTSPAVSLLKLADDGTVVGAFSAGSTFTDFAVQALVLSGSDLFVGAQNRVVKMNATTGALDTGFDSDGIVELVHSNPNVIASAFSMTLSASNLFVGGRFTSVNASVRSNLAKLSAVDGSVDGSFNVALGLNDAVRALSLFNANNSLVLGGEFSALGGTAAGRLARFSASGAFSSVFNSRLGTGFDADVRALLFSSGQLLVGGAFENLNQNSKSRLVRFTDLDSASGSLVDATFDASTGGNMNGEVRALAAAPDSSGDALVGGTFTTYRGVAVPGLMRIDSDGTRDSSFALGIGFTANPGRIVSINSIAVSSFANSAYSIFVGGDFRTFRSTSSPNLVKVSHLGARDVGFAVGSDGFDKPVHALQLSGSNLFVGGGFGSYKRAVAEGLVNVNANTAAPIVEAGLGGGEVRALQIDSSGKIWAGGSFTRVAGVSSGPLVRLEPSSLDLVLEGGTTAADAANVIAKTVLGAHAPDEWNSAGAGDQYNSGIFGIHSLLFAEETVNASPVTRLYLGGFFSLFRALSGNNNVRIDLSGNEATTP